MFNKYYQEELAFLRDLGEEFAAAHPEVAHMLSGAGSDPDVERLLEGFAFLTGRIRQKLDDELPELTHTLIRLLWPHYLRPIPALSIVEFTPRPGVLRGGEVVRRGAEIDSIPVEGTPCRFQTTRDVEVWPIELREARIDERAGAAPRLTLRIGPVEGASLGALGVDRLRLFLHGEPAEVYPLYDLLTRRATALGVEARLGGQTVARRDLDATAIQAAGFAGDEPLFPYPANCFPGYRLLQEYFALPAKFLAVELSGLATAALGAAEEWLISIPFRRGAGGVARVEADNLRLFCTPVVNLFAHRADPIRVDQERAAYRVRPEGDDPRHYEIYAVERVVGWEQGSGRERVYEPFYSFSRRMAEAGGESAYYDLRLVESVASRGGETYLSLVTSGALAPVETVAVELTCTNRRLPSSLGVGEIRVPTATSPEFATFTNIARVTPSVPPPLGEGLHWRLISHLTLNYLPMASADALRGVLELYNAQARVDRQAAAAHRLRLESIREVRAEAADLLFKGVVVRGSEVAVSLDEAGFAGDGDIVLFGRILAEFFALLSTLNAFTRLTIRGAQHGEIYRWPARLGQQTLL
ncbi:MAG: type VI secretion system baseplate subunit TssF [Nitrospirae bacterium CG_4_10_14_3_um_filter_70_108]|nr:MAG: type VI secretion system baseplate subunit TssF [Nitrospirae bacterium CG_4_10_14_3_um_filter_70_108]